MVRHDSYDVGELRNTRDGEGNSPLNKWTKHGYSIEGEDLVRRVKKQVVKEDKVNWRTKKKAEITAFREKSIVTGIGEVESIVEEEIPSNWDFDKWRKWAPKQTYYGESGPELRWKGMSRPLVRGDLRWELPPGDERNDLRQRYEKGQQNYIYIKIPLPEVTEEDVEETIPIIEVDFKAVVTGAYYDSSDRKVRSFDIEGTKTIELGIEPPEGVGNVPDFWEDIWTDARNEIFPHEDRILGTALSSTVGASVNGEWINRLMSRASRFQGFSDITDALTGANLPQNAKWEYWFNKKASAIASGTELQNKVSSEATERGIF